MLIAIDKRGSINLPIAVRKELGLKSGSYLDMEIVEGGGILLRPVAIYPGITLDVTGSQKLDKARESGDGMLPTWLVGDMEDAALNTKR